MILALVRHQRDLTCHSPLGLLAVSLPLGSRKQIPEMLSDELTPRQAAELALFAIHAAHDALGINFQISNGGRFEKLVDVRGGAVYVNSKAGTQPVGLPGMPDQDGHDNAAQKPHDKLLRDRHVYWL